MVSNTLALFRDPESALAAAAQLKNSGFDGLEVMSPIPIHGIDDVLGEKKSVNKIGSNFINYFFQFNTVFFKLKQPLKIFR